MKYAKLLAAAAIVAAGVNAQAADQTSATYCVITLPVAVGYNLYGIAVNPIAEATYSAVLGIGSSDTVEEGGNSWSGNSVASFKKAVWWTGVGNEPSPLYQYGLDASSESVTFTLPLAGYMDAFAANRDIPLSAFTAEFSKGSGKLPNASANMVEMWDKDVQGWKKYYYRSSKNAWYLKGPNDAGAGSVVADPESVVIHAGEGFYLQCGTGYSGAATITYPAQ